PRQQAALAAGSIADAAIGLVAPAPADDRAATDPGPASNVIELDTPQIRRPDRLPVPRINPRGVVLAMRLSEALVVAAAGAIAYWLQPVVARPADLTSAFTALAVMSMAARFPSEQSRLVDDVQRRPLLRQLADGALRTLIPFVLSILVVIALVPVGHLSRAP